ncbi:MAG: 6,7-dimethyl-8-ribityllumazine synthase [Pseudomonadota bacterium]
MKQLEITPSGQQCRIGIAVARFNSAVTDLLMEGCVSALNAHGVRQEDITVVRVPGAWELPLTCQTMAESAQFDGLVALGAVVRGETAHFEFISGACARGLSQVSLTTGIPVAFGVLTPENADQAFERADPARKDKGREAALATLEMIGLKRALQDG